MHRSVGSWPTRKQTYSFLHMLLLSFMITIRMAVHACLRISYSMSRVCLISTSTTRLLNLPIEDITPKILAPNKPVSFMDLAYCRPGPRETRTTEHTKQSSAAETIRARGVLGFDCWPAVAGRTASTTHRRWSIRVSRAYQWVWTGRVLKWRKKTSLMHL